MCKTVPYPGCEGNHCVLIVIVNKMSWFVHIKLHCINKHHMGETGQKNKDSTTKLQLPYLFFLLEDLLLPDYVIGRPVH